MFTVWYYRSSLTGKYALMPAFGDETKEWNDATDVLQLCNEATLLVGLTYADFES
ncbi:MAG: hypothetical protein IPO08_18515 [Xanthomonadales bacterium]|nr:hypothetical protein [Xanthomonadales bacterium]